MFSPGLPVVFLTKRRGTSLMLPLLGLKGSQLGLQAALPQLRLFQAVPALPGLLGAAEGTWT